MADRATRKKAAPGELRMFYGQLPGEYDDVIIANGVGTSRYDAALLHWVICTDRPSAVPGDPYHPNLIRELKDRGYDITTLEFRIRKKAAQPEKSP